jgi:hypothetical protein
MFFFQLRSSRAVSAEGGKKEVLARVGRRVMKTLPEGEDPRDTGNHLAPPRHPLLNMRGRITSVRIKLSSREKEKQTDRESGSFTPADIPPRYKLLLKTLRIPPFNSLDRTQPGL